MRNRIIFNVVLLGAVFYTSWFVVAVIAFAGAFFYSMYYEIIVFGMLIDILYGASSFPFGGIFGILGAIVIFFFALHTKRNVR